jgi:hypothetical protein
MGGCFYDMIAAKYNGTLIGKSPIETWQNKIRHLRHFLIGWAKNNSGVYKKRRRSVVFFYSKYHIYL